MVLARANRRFLLIERGEFCGAKNVSGGVLWGTDLARLVPEYWKQSTGYERVIAHRRLTFLDDQSAFAHLVLGLCLACAPLGAWLAVRGDFSGDLVVEELALRAGAEVWVALKATEVGVAPA